MPKVAPATLILGSDEPGVKERAAQFAASMASNPALETEIFDAWVERREEMERSIRSAIAAIQTPSLFASDRLVWIKNATFLGDSTEAKSDDIQAAVAELVSLISSGLPEGVTLLISASEVDRRRTATKQIEKACAVEVLESPTKSKDWDRHGAPDYVAQLLDAAGASWSRDVPQAVVSRCGGDPRTLRSEVEKLALYTGANNRISAADAEIIVAMNPGASHWTWCDAVLEGRTDEALSLLRELEFQDRRKDQPVPLMIAVAGRCQLALICRLLMDRKLLTLGQNGARWDDEALEFLPKNKDGKPPHPYYIFSVCKVATRRPMAGWLALFEVVYNNYSSVFRGDLDGYRQLEMMLLSIATLDD